MLSSFVIDTRLRRKVGGDSRYVDEYNCCGGNWSEDPDVPSVMTSNAIRGIRRKKSSLCEVKVAVIGAPGVGKSGEFFMFLC